MYKRLLMALEASRYFSTMDLLLVMRSAQTQIPVVSGIFLAVRQYYTVAPRYPGQLKLKVFVRDSEESGTAEGILVWRNLRIRDFRTG